MGGDDPDRSTVEQGTQWLCNSCATSSSNGLAARAVTTQSDEVDGNLGVSLGGDRLGGDEARSGNTGGPAAVGPAHLRRPDGDAVGCSNSAACAVSTQGAVVVSDNMGVSLGGDSLGGDEARSGSTAGGSKNYYPPINSCGAPPINVGKKKL